MNIEGDNLICACLQGISQNLRSGHEQPPELNLKYINALECLFRTWFGSSIQDEYRKWCENLNQGRGIHSDIFQESPDFVFHDRAFWKASALDYIQRHIETNLRRFTSVASETSLTANAAAAMSNPMSVRSLLIKDGENVLKDGDVSFRFLDTHSLHSGYPICVCAGPQLPDDRHLLAVAFEDLTLQIVEYKHNSVKVLSTTRFAPKPEQFFPAQTEIDVVRIHLAYALLSNCN